MCYPAIPSFGSKNSHSPPGLSTAAIRISSTLPRKWPTRPIWTGSKCRYGSTGSLWSNSHTPYEQSLASNSSEEHLWVHPSCGPASAKNRECVVRRLGTAWRKWRHPKTPNGHMSNDVRSHEDATTRILNWSPRLAEPCNSTNNSSKSKECK